MPIYEYVCKDCSRSFETLVRASTTVECPSCRSTALEKQLSAFTAAVKNQAAPADFSAGACGTCGDPRGPGSCSIN